jgi:hypothetical protein
MFFAARRPKIDEAREEGDEVERALRRLATPERRTTARGALDGVVEMRCANGEQTRALTIDLGEGGWGVLSAIAPGLDELVCLELNGLVVEARVRHIARQGLLYRVGLEAF